jgi:hypothetical protein
VLWSNLGGCSFAEDPARSGSEAIVAWSGDIDPACARFEARPCSKDANAFLIGRLGKRASVLVAKTGQQHITINDGRTCIRVDVLVGSVLDGAVSLNLIIDNVAAADTQIRTVQALIAAHNKLHSPIPHARFLSRNSRIVSALRVYDALCDGASYREIAIALFGQLRVDAEWNGASDSMRSRVRRLVGLTRSLAAGGWRELLR